MKDTAAAAAYCEAERSFLVRHFAKFACKKNNERHFDILIFTGNKRSGFFCLCVHLRVPKIDEKKVAKKGQGAFLEGRVQGAFLEGRVQGAFLEYHYSAFLEEHVCAEL